MGVQNRLLVMKYTILFTTFFFALASSKESDYYSNLSDDTFCQYVGTWVDRAEKLTPGFKWNIDQMCKDGKYQLEIPGLFCDVLTEFYGNGESWCSSYASCTKTSHDSGTLRMYNLENLLIAQEIQISI